MEMRQIQYFLALCEEGNFTRAAARCGVSQPSLSNAIKQLETELGGPLFERNRNKSRLTDLGILLRPDLVLIDRSAAEAERKAGKFLAARPTTHQPRAMEAFMRAYHIIAVVAVILIGFGAKLFFFSAPPAEATIHAVPSASMNVLQMHVDHPNIKNMPVQKVHDLSFVYSDSD